MFKGLVGLKNLVKGGINVVAEQSSQFAEQVVSDPASSKERIKGTIKKTVQGGVAGVVDVGEQVIGGATSADSTSNAIEKATEVVHNVKHHGAFVEEYLGYSDPTNDIRKAVKRKEKAAKKARKDRKKKTGKKQEDLFDPENLAKYKKELEQKKKEENTVVEDNLAFGSEHKENFVKDNSKQENQPPEKAESPPRTPEISKHDDWNLFLDLTSGTDNLIKKKKEQLLDLKEYSYFQQKKSSNLDLSSSDSSKTNRLKSKQHWVDLNKPEFDDIEGVIEASEEEQEEEETIEEKHFTPTEKICELVANLEEKQTKEEEVDDDDVEAIFNTDFVDDITSGKVKLVAIPDSPTEDDDPFNTEFADVVVKAEAKHKKVEANKLKFSGLSSVADVLSGKAHNVDKDIVEHTVKRKRRRANRINLIADAETGLTALEDIDTDSNKQGKQVTVDVLAVLDGENKPSEYPNNVVLDCVSTPLKTSPSLTDEIFNENKQKTDFSEFGCLTDSETVNIGLTSNIAILAGEFSKPVEVEEDEFDIAFDALAQAAVTKTQLEELEQELYGDDIFDTSCAERILGLASLTNVVKKDEVILDTFDDKDPFDTTDYEHITYALEVDQDFDSLASRELGENQDIAVILTKFEGDNIWESDSITKESEEWSAFEEKNNCSKPPRPLPPKTIQPKSVSEVVIDSPSKNDTPMVVVKAPSLESIKSWNYSVANSLIEKTEEEAKKAKISKIYLDSETDKEEEEADPFDTSEFKEFDITEIADPFDTSGGLDESEDFIKSEAIKENDYKEQFNVTPLAEHKEPEVIDLLSNNPEEDQIDIVTIQPISRDILAQETDPFDTEFAAQILPNKGDPFDTSFVRGLPGKAEIRALEEEFLDEENFDPREGSFNNKIIEPGTAGRPRPKHIVVDEFEKTTFKSESEILAQIVSTVESNIEEEIDPFDTSIVNSVIPMVTKTTGKKPEVDDFNPAESFKISIQQKNYKKSADGVGTNKETCLSDDDFDPRA